MIKKALLIIGFCMAGTLSGMQREKSRPDETLRELRTQYEGLTKQKRSDLLLQCAREGNVIPVQVLLKLATPVNCTDKNKWTPLHWAAHCGHVEVVKLLLGRPDVEVNVADSDGARPLHLAAQHGHVEVVKLLLGKAGVEVNAAANDGFMPLAYRSSVWSRRSC